jgi:hypothetical protein
MLGKENRKEAKLIHSIVASERVSERRYRPHCGNPRIKESDK